MSLTGGLFLGLVAGVAIGAFVVLVVRWPSLTGRSPGRIAARVGTLVLVNVLVLLTAATQLNARYLFFADWTDLQGAMNGTVIKTSLTRGAAAAKAASRSLPGPAATTPGSRPSLPAGTTEGKAITYTVHGPLSGLDSTVVVQLPRGYLSLANAGVSYPVLETFQGYPGSPNQWVTAMPLKAVMTREVDARRMRPALIVSPQVEIPAGVDTEGVNGRPGFPQLETWLSQDVPNWVARTFRVSTNRSSWATIGLSAGGWCAAMTTMLHPAQYGAAIVLGGYFRPEFGPLYEPYPAKSALAARYDLVALTKRASPSVALWLETSHSDSVSYSSSAALLTAVRPPLSVKAVVLRHAGHRLGVWEALLPDALTWLGANVPGFSP